MPLLLGPRLTKARVGHRYSATLNSTLALVAQTRTVLRSAVAAALGATAALTKSIAHSLVAGLVLSSARSMAIAAVVGSALAASTRPIALIRHTLADAIALGASAGAHVFHPIAVAVSSTLALATSAHSAALGRLHSTLRPAVGITQRTLAHTVHPVLALATHKTSALSHSLGASALGIISIVTRFHPAIKQFLWAGLRALGFRSRRRTVALVAHRPAAYTAPRRTTALTGSWEDEALIAIPLRSDDAPPYVSPGEANVGFSVDLSSALGTFTIASAAVASVTTRDADESDSRATALTGWVTHVVPGSNSLTLVCGDGTQVEDQLIEVALNVTLTGSPAAVWRLYLELPVRKGAPD